MSSFFSSLRLRLLCLALLALLPAAGLAAYSGFEQRRIAAQQARLEAQRLTRATSASIEQTIESSHRLLVALAHLPEVREERAENTGAVFASLLREHAIYANLGLVAPDGQLAASGVPFTGGMDLSDRGWFRRALAQRGFVVGDYQIGRVTRKATLNVACPVYDAAGRVHGVVFAAIDLGYLNGYAARTELPAGAALMVVDRRGVILARYPEPERWVGHLLPEVPSVRAVLAQGAGTAVVRGLDGVMRLWSFNPIPGGPEASAYVALGLSRDAAYAQADRVLRQSLLVLAMVLVVALLAAWAGARLFILRRVDALAKTTERIRGGDLAARTGMSGKGDELDQLGRALDAMAASLQVRARDAEQAAAALRESEHRFRSLADGTPVLLWVTDASMACTFANKPMLDFSGCRLEDVAGDGWVRAVHPDDRARLLGTAEFAYRSKQPFTVEHRVRRHDGVYRWVLDTAVPQFTADGEFTGYIGSCVDITERRTMEEALRESQERFQAYMDNSPAVAFLKDEDGRMIYVNRPFETFFQTTLEQIRGKSDFELWPPETAQQLREHDLAVLASGQPMQTYEDVPAPDGTPHHWLVLKFPVVEPSGARRIGGTAIDVTEQKMLERQLHHSQKMEAIGRLAGGVAHDFNNLLTAIQGFSELLLRRSDVHPTAKRDLEEIHKAAVRAAGLTRQLLAFSRQQATQPRVLDLNDVVADLSKMLRRVIGADIQLQTVAAAGLGRVKVDPGQIEQVIANLVVNARDAMPRGGRVLVETANVEAGAGAGACGALAPGPCVVLSVKDTGIGMDAETMRHIFEPFFTTKEAGKGTGLGLSTVYGIVRQCGGDIAVQSEPGRGTTFSIYLPRVEEEAEAAAGVPARVELKRGAGTVLLVEDEDMVRGLVRETLELAGYEVLEARHGKEALTVCDQHPGPIHLMVTDVVMPEMGGPELVKHLPARRSGMKVLFLSGHAQAAFDHPGLTSTKAAFLQKPFALDAFTRKVRDVLDEAA